MATPSDNIYQAEQMASIAAEEIAGNSKCPDNQMMAAHLAGALANIAIAKINLELVEEIHMLNRRLEEQALAVK